MGLNDPDLRFAYALDALDAEESLAVEAELATSAEAAVQVAVLRHAAGELAAALTLDEQPPTALRDRTLAAALAARPGAPAAPADPREVHRIEAERFAALLRGLHPADWDRPVDPPEFAGWTVLDLASHVTASQTLFAQLAGHGLDVPETALDNDGRTAQARDRHRQAGPAALLAEYERAVDAIATTLDGREPGDLDTEVSWWGTPMGLSTVCIHRGFETWTHADDIRRAVGGVSLPPPASSLATMSTRAAEWSPLMLAAAGAEHPPGVAVLDLTGPGGATHRIELGLEPAAPDAVPAFTLRLDVVEYCRAVGNRTAHADLAFDADGDVALARELFDALPALAGL